MNGRVYDPLVGKFISADPILQDPMNGQSYNRYAYVLNNPTNLTDPTGFCSAGKTEVTGSSICQDLNGAAGIAESLGTKGTGLERFSVTEEKTGKTVAAGVANSNGDVRISPKNNSETANSKTYFIGGAADKYKEFGQGPTNIMGDLQKQFAREAPAGADSAYYGYQDRKEIVGDITDVKEKDPLKDINLIGHSRGGALAINIANNELAKANIKINLLITIDPVGSQITTPGLWMPSNPLNNVGTFININANPKSRDITDRIAWAGGHYGSATKDLKPFHFDLNFNHGQAGPMLNAPLALPGKSNTSAWDFLMQNVRREEN